MYSSILVSVVSLLSFVTAHTAPCPTITTTLACSTCPIPACAQISSLTIHCGCNSGVQTSTVTLDCAKGCGGEPKCAGTQYLTAIEDCFPTQTDTTTSTTTTSPTGGPGGGVTTSTSTSTQGGGGGGSSGGEGTRSTTTITSTGSGTGVTNAPPSTFTGGACRLRIG